jgi:hypothetical protein
LSHSVRECLGLPCRPRPEKGTRFRWGQTEGRARPAEPSPSRSFRWEASQPMPCKIRSVISSQPTPASTASRHVGPEVAVAASHGANSPLLDARGVASGSWCGHAWGGLARSTPGRIRARSMGTTTVAAAAWQRAWGGSRDLAATTCCCWCCHRLERSLAFADTGYSPSLIF